jgi:hypothetical protein
MTQGTSLRGVNAALTDEYDAPTTVIQDELLKFAADLCDHGLCRVSERGEHV